MKLHEIKTLFRQAVQFTSDQMNSISAIYVEKDYWVTLAFHPKEALVFKNADNVWKGLKTTYNNDFRNLVYGNNFPTDESILEILIMIRERLSGMEWKIEIQKKQ